MVAVGEGSVDLADGAGLAGVFRVGGRGGAEDVEGGEGEMGLLEVAVVEALGEEALVGEEAGERAVIGFDVCLDLGKDLGEGLGFRV